MKTFITGATGLLGYNLITKAVEAGFTVIATYHMRKPKKIKDIKWIQMNLEDLTDTTELVRRLKPDIIVHSAAYTDVDACEVNREYAYKVNYLSTLALARTASKINSHMIYISTDYVFDGERGLYSEQDVPNPINYYGLTKLLGEVAVSGIVDKYLIVRVSGLYGYSPTGRKNFGISVLEKLMRSEEVLAFYDQYLSPTYVEYLAENIVKAIERGIGGIVHIAGERLSRLEFALLVAEILGVDKSLIKPVSMNEVRLVAKRPRDSSLNTNLAKHLGLGLPKVRECIKSFIKSYMEGKE